MESNKVTEDECNCCGQGTQQGTIERQVAPLGFLKWNVFRMGPATGKCCASWARNCPVQPGSVPC